ncbi:MAG: DUF4301 family protein [Bacteroidales bacterium]|nr:DUF4301 family protein [Bacteroidales bacterium]
MFSKKDLKQIKKKGIDFPEIETQINNFKNGFPYLEIVAPAIIDNGIIVLNDEEKEKYIKLYDDNLDSKSVVKFVPASGAASRMFRNLFEMIENYQGTEHDYLRLLADRSFNSLFYIYEHMEEFAFFDELKNIFIEKKLDIHDCFKKRNYTQILSLLLFKDGLNYSNLPKGLIKFHKYKKSNRTAFEEHLVEGIEYSAVKRNVTIHFTVSPEHYKLIRKHIKEVKKYYEKKYEVKFNISYSEQKSCTDTIAVNLTNEPLRDSDGKLVFRPGGHGALLENLNDIQADIIFVKNIDNVVPDRLKQETIIYKKAFAGILIEYQEKIYKYLYQINNTEDINDKLIKEILNFLHTKLFIIPPENLNIKDKKKVITYIKKKLNRPIRICGMVKNEGEPGGGPYWAKNSDDSVSLQIVEGSQFNPKDKKQKKIIGKATYFNPVDLICATNNYKGKKFDLLKFRDNNTGFISKKSKDGIDLKALELPGLWNGAMSDWNTIFVEVPIITFNPVKTINDLLRKEHQEIS